MELDELATKNGDIPYVPEALFWLESGWTFGLKCSIQVSSIYRSTLVHFWFNPGDVDFHREMKKLTMIPVH